MRRHLKSRTPLPPFDNIPDDWLLGTFDRPGPVVRIPTTGDASEIFQRFINVRNNWTSRAFDFSSHPAGMKCRNPDPGAPIRDHQADAPQAKSDLQSAIDAAAKLPMAAATFYARIIHGEPKNFAQLGLEAVPPDAANDLQLAIDAATAVEVARDRLNRALADRCDADELRPAELPVPQLKGVKPENEMWRVCCEVALEAFATCIEEHNLERWKHGFTEPCDLIHEGASAGYRIWMRQIMDFAFPISSPEDAAWFLKLLAEASSTYDPAHRLVGRCELVGYGDETVMRLAWPFLVGRHFETDPIDRKSTRAEWRAMSRADKQNWDGFKSFADERPLKKFFDFINEIESTPDPPTLDPAVRERAFCESVINRAREATRRFLGAIAAKIEVPQWSAGLQDPLAELQASLLALSTSPPATPDRQPDPELLEQARRILAALATDKKSAKISAIQKALKIRRQRAFNLVNWLQENGP